jgi:hypothetical protein
MGHSHKLRCIWIRNILNAGLLWPHMVLSGKCEQSVCRACPTGGSQGAVTYRQPEGRIRPVVYDVRARRGLARLLGSKALVEWRRKDVALEQRDLLDNVLCA